MGRLVFRPDTGQKDDETCENLKTNFCLRCRNFLLLNLSYFYKKRNFSFIFSFCFLIFDEKHVKFDRRNKFSINELIL